VAAVAPRVKRTGGVAKGAGTSAASTEGPSSIGGAQGVKEVVASNKIGIIGGASGSSKAVKTVAFGRTVNTGMCSDAMLIERIATTEYGCSLYIMLMPRVSTQAHIDLMMCAHECTLRHCILYNFTCAGVVNGDLMVPTVDTLLSKCADENKLTYAELVVSTCSYIYGSLINTK
jgi:hypothetical protein